MRGRSTFRMARSTNYMGKSFFDRLTGSVKINDAVLHEENNVMHEVKPTASRIESVPLRPKKIERKIISRDESEVLSLKPEDQDEEEALEGQLTVDIYDDGVNIVIQSTVAGVKPEDVDVAITNDMVTIRGKRKRHHEINEENYYYKELYWGSFSRSVILPEEVDADRAEAVIKNGLLTLTLPKKQRDMTKKIRVKGD